MAPKLDVYARNLNVHAHSPLPLHMEWHQKNYFSTRVIGAASKLDVRAPITPMFSGNVTGTYIYYYFLLCLSLFCTVCTLLFNLSLHNDRIVGTY